MARRPDPFSSADAALVSTRLPVTGIASQLRVPPPPSQDDHSRYENLGRLAQGGAGVIYRVHDRILNRMVVMKMLRPEYADNRGMIARFLHEAQVVAQLQHPAIVPVHDLGQLPDGRWFLTMKEIRGRTLSDLVSELHKARIDAAKAVGDRSRGFVPLEDGWTFRRVIDAFRTVCTAVGFAHARGVLHRDLKPDNIMIGDFGEVLVLDWGLAKLMHAGDQEKAVVHPSPLMPDGRPYTLPGAVVGTPAYMAPEQAAGDASRLGPWSDVWSLGGILYAILYGRPPYTGDAETVLKQVRTAPPEPVAEVPVPEPLVEVWQRAMRMDPAKRYPRADAIADDIDAWIEGSRNRDRALALVEEARAAIPDLRKAQERAARQRERSRCAVLSLRPSDPLEVKEAAWAAEDEAERLQEEVESRTLEVATRLRMALAQAPGLPEARSLLADLYRERAEAAEATGNPKAAQVYRALLAEHDDGRHADYLRADAPFELITDPPGASVEILRYKQKARRLVPEPWTTTGPTPIRGMRLPVGSYLLRISADSRATLRYPVHIVRTSGWNPTPPGHRSPQPVVLPRTSQIGPDERLVPAGWFISGGDPEANGALPRQRVWVDSFSMGVRPVTNREYLAFLNDLVKRGHPQRAALHVPRVVPAGMEAALPAFDFRDGRWTLPERVGEMALSPDAPVVYVSWYDAQAYCLWLGERTGLPWRLPGELEREKAARGVDGRAFPWGDLADPAFHCMQQSALDEPGPPPPDRFPVDESPYGILGLAGGVTEWCADPMRAEGPPRRGSRAITPKPPTPDDTRAGAHDPRRVARGGAWDLPARACRAASRTGHSPDRRAPNLGFRVCRSLEDQSSSNR